MGNTFTLTHVTRAHVSRETWLCRSRKRTETALVVSRTNR